MGFKEFCEVSTFDFGRAAKRSGLGVTSSRYLSPEVLAEKTGALCTSTSIGTQNRFRRNAGFWGSWVLGLLGLFVVLEPVDRTVFALRRTWSPEGQPHCATFASS